MDDQEDYTVTMGYKMPERLGFEQTIPEQGFYNVGQKFFATPSILGGILIALTGISMYLYKLIIDSIIVQWSILIHPPSQETPHSCGEECYCHPLRRDVALHARRMITP